MMHDEFIKPKKQNQYTDEQKDFHKVINYSVENNCIEEIFGKKCKSNFTRIINSNIKEQEIWKAIKQLKRENGMGCDNIHNMMIIEGKHILVPIILRIFNI